MKYKLVKKNPKNLKLSHHNVRKINPKERLETMALSIKHYNGPFLPLIINKKDEIICGQRRWLASLEANIEEIDCLQTDLTEEEELLLSWLENELQEPVDSRDRSIAVRKLLNKGFTYEDLEIISGLPRATLVNLVLVSEIPEPIKKAPEEIKQKAISELEKISNRRKTLVDRALKYTPLKDNLKASLDFIEWAEKAPLHDIEQRIKELRQGMKVDLELAKEQIEKPQEWVFITTRFKKDTYEKAKNRAKKQAKDFNAILQDLLDMWANGLIDDRL